MFWKPLLVEHKRNTALEDDYILNTPYTNIEGQGIVSEVRKLESKKLFRPYAVRTFRLQQLRQLDKEHEVAPGTYV
jgi:hypothetical protein